jgi:cell division protein FtsI (penicillin-binding protein 3)
MEVKLIRRTRALSLVSLILFLLLALLYTRVQLAIPAPLRSQLVLTRGEILASNGMVLAETVQGKRVYPQGSLAGQLIGMMGTDQGLSGIEYFYNHRLASGHSVTLTIDPTIQAIAQQVLDKEAKKQLGMYGSVVVLDTRTAQVLAVANYPSFDPNHWRRYSPKVQRNTAFNSEFEPGSVMKGLTVGAVLNSGYATPTQVFPTPMQRVVGGVLIHDVVPHPGHMTIQGILQYSSNIGMSHVVQHFPARLMHRYFAQYGFGQPTGVPKIYTDPGQLNPWQTWGTLGRATMAFGQGVATTTLQLAAAYNVLADNGIYQQPQVVEGAKRQPPVQVLHPAVTRLIRGLLRIATAIQIPYEATIPGYSLGGKTGTAQEVVSGGRYSNSIYDSTYTGFFPAEEPRITVAVMIHGAKRNYFGSDLAAPIFRDIAAGVLSHWNIPPANGGLY